MPCSRVRHGEGQVTSAFTPGIWVCWSIPSSSSVAITACQGAHIQDHPGFLPAGQMLIRSGHISAGSVSQEEMSSSVGACCWNSPALF